MAGSAHFEVYPSGRVAKGYRYRLVAANGEIVIGPSQKYRDLTDVDRAIVDLTRTVKKATREQGAKVEPRIEYVDR